MADHYERLSAALADRYTLRHELGAGGMATVYLAQDRKHDRPVAVKVLGEALTVVLGAERFLHEIRVTANLHHPNIVQLYDSGEADGLLYYVMPLVEGESLRQKINRERQLGVDEAVGIAQTVAGALDYAHRHGVIHRDIKPENILLQDGTPLVADFGIALAVSRADDERLTESGLSLGTPHYMSPEQAIGDRDLTAHTDVYALGTVLYEMLVGDPPFAGTNQQAVVARVVGGKPTDLRTIRDSVPAHVEAAVARALAKVPADRFATAGAFADALANPGFATPSPPSPSREHRRWPARYVGLGLFVGIAAVGTGVWIAGRDDLDAGPTARGIRPVTSFAGWEHAPSWSPDGSMIAYVHIAGGDADVATLPIGGGDPLILTEDSPADEMNPAWAPDGSRIAYTSDRGAGTNVYWIRPTGGAERKIAETHIPALERLAAWNGALDAGAWSPDASELVFSRLQPGGQVALWKVNVETLEETQLTNPPPGVEDLQASWARDGRRILFTREDKGIRRLWLLSAAGRDTSLVELGPGSNPAWFPDDARMAFVQTRNIWEMELGTRVVRQLTVGATGNDAAPVVAGNGSIAYANWDHEIDIYWLQPGAPGRDHERLTAFTGSHFGARVSPDGDRVLYSSNRAGSFDLWLLDRTTGQHFPLTDGPADDRLPDWSPDGRDAVMLSNRGGTVGLWLVRVETGAVRRLTDHELPWATHLAEGQGGPRWSPDGRVIGYVAPEAGNAVWLVAPDGSNRRPTTVRGVLSFSFYRDGSRVVYTRRAPDGSGLVELRATHVGSGEDVLLRAGAIAEIDVSPDGTALTFIEAVSHFTMELYLLPLIARTSPDGLPHAGGEPQRLTFGNGVWHVHSGGWAPDGTGVVYSRDRDYGDIYVIEPERR